MKQFKEKALGLEELSIQEMELVNGGVPWGRIFQAIGRFVGEAVAAWGIDQALSWLFNNQDKVDQVVPEGYQFCYWAYGGELEAAICVADE